MSKEILVLGSGHLAWQCAVVPHGEVLGGFRPSRPKLHKLAVLAASLKHFIHDESTERLVSIYQALELQSMLASGVWLRDKLARFGTRYPAW